jgi:hypothetical protein
MLNPSSQRISQGDRFISQRSFGDDAAAKFGTKLELFNPEEPVADTDETRRTNMLISPKQESTLLEEENKKMYTALLQNQVLGVDNPFLLHEIHNQEDNFLKTNLYS